MTNHLEYAILSDISSIVNANNSVLFSLGEINWLLQVCLMPMPMLLEFSESMAALLVPQSDRNRQLFQSH
jgi:hypothetical protein